MGTSCQLRVLPIWFASLLRHERRGNGEVESTDAEAEGSAASPWSRAAAELEQRLGPRPSDDELFDVAVALIRDVGDLLVVNPAAGGDGSSDLASDLNRALIISPRDALVATATVASELASRLSQATEAQFDDVLSSTASAARRRVQ